MYMYSCHLSSNKIGELDVFPIVGLFISLGKRVVNGRYLHVVTKIG